MKTMLATAVLLLGLCTVVDILAEPLGAHTDALNVKPNRCVALRQGQYCYQKLQFTWQNFGKDRVCLYERGSSEPLTCWANSEPYKFIFRFKSTENKTFFLKNERTQLILSEVEVVVAWVYKSGKQVSTGWRLF